MAVLRFSANTIIKQSSESQQSETVEERERETDRERERERFTLSLLSSMLSSGPLSPASSPPLMSQQDFRCKEKRS